MKKVLLIFCSILCLSGCSLSMTEDQASTETVDSIIQKMLDTYNSQKEIGIYCGVSDGQYNITSSYELYCDIANNNYTAVYTDMADKQSTKQIRYNRDTREEYLSEEYGWVKRDGTVDYSSIYKNLFNFIESSNFKLITDFTSYKDELGDKTEFAIDYDNYYILESVTQSDDKKNISYVNLMVDKTSYLPKYIIAQTYAKQQNDVVVREDTKEIIVNGNKKETTIQESHSDVITEGKIFALAYYSDADEQTSDFFHNIVSIPTDNVFTEEEYYKQYK